MLPDMFRAVSVARRRAHLARVPGATPPVGDCTDAVEAWQRSHEPVLRRDKVILTRDMATRGRAQPLAPAPQRRSIGRRIGFHADASASVHTGMPLTARTPRSPTSDSRRSNRGALPAGTPAACPQDSGDPPNSCCVNAATCRPTIATDDRSRNVQSRQPGAGPTPCRAPAPFDWSTAALRRATKLGPGADRSRSADRHRTGLRHLSSRIAHRERAVDTAPTWRIS
jgi:hypothetical protein